MKVLGLVASPRKLGNSELLVKEMLAALPEETEKEMLRLADLTIEPCKACYACLPQEKNCVIADQLSFLLDKIRQADAVIVASACYFLGAHTSIKSVSDRLISVLANHDDFGGKRCVTVTTYGIPGWEGYAREMVNNFARFLHFEVVGDMLVQAASPGEAATPPILAQARQLAAKLLTPVAAVAPATEDVICCAHCGSSLLQVKPSGAVRCVMCNGQGGLISKDETYEVVFTEGHRRFSQQGMTEHAQLLEEVKNSYIANRHELYRRRKAYDTYNWWIKVEEK